MEIQNFLKGFPKNHSFFCKISLVCWISLWSSLWIFHSSLWQSLLQYFATLHSVQVLKTDPSSFLPHAQQILDIFSSKRSTLIPRLAFIHSCIRMWYILTPGLSSACFKQTARYFLISVAINVFKNRGGHHFLGTYLFEGNRFNWKQWFI